jgi:tetratricopeptide (TPR) repeat protein
VTDLAEVRAAFERGEHELVLQLTDAALATRPGDDALHEYRSRAFLALGRTEEARRHAADAVRLDPDEIRYRELLAQSLSAEGAHRDAAAEYGRLARKDPRQAAWTVREAEERLGAAQARTGDPRGALAAAEAAERLLPGDPDAREAHADALWLAGDRADAFDRFRQLAGDAGPADRARLERKARILYRQAASGVGRLVASAPALFAVAFRRGWMRVER